ncbi:MAG: serine/threonine-protein kinase [Planctomycetota bacterium]
MDPSRHDRISELFLAACELAPEERASYLDRTCGGDAELRAAVESLLKHDADPTPLDQPVGDAGWAHDALTGLGSLPERIGEYEILDLLGEGGMGIVYRARQRHPERDVALKVVRAGFAGPETVRRFQVEATLLGRLRHPGIAQIFEAGVEETRAGDQPFFAMELVEGVAFDEWLREARPRTAVCIEMLAQIAEAVAHAHHQGIAHRDLKPSNILVDFAGKPRIVDFGVARAVDDGGEGTLLTRTGQLVGTLAYMSPEQVAGDPSAVDVRTDVYSLGVILYEALTGRRPLEVEGLPLVEVASKIASAEPVRLGAIDRQLRGDVDVIAAKALEKERERRYGSAALLAQDLRRCLADEPIEARPPSTIYQLTKLARRHRAIVTGTAVAMVALIAGLAAALVQANRATHAAETAELETARATAALAESDAVVDFLSQLLESVHPDRLGREVRVDDVLEEATGRLENEFDDRPVVKARLAAAVGRSWNALGKRDRGRKALGVAVPIFAEKLGDLDPRTVRARARYGLSCNFIGASEEGLEICRRAYADACVVFGEDDIETLEIRAGVAGCLASLGEMEEAERTMADLVEVGERVAPEHPVHLEHMQSWAGLQRSLGRFERGIEIARQAYERCAETLGPDHWRTIGMGVGLGLELYSNSHFAEAIEVLEPMHARSAEIFGAEHTETVDAAQFLGLAYVESRRFDEADELLAAAVAACEAKFGRDNASTLLARRYRLQVPLRSEQYDAESLQLAEEIADGYARVYGPDHPDAIEALATVGRFQESSGQKEEGLATLGEALDRARRVLPLLNPHRVQATSTVAALLRKLGRREEALETIDEIALTEDAATLEAYGGIFGHVMEIRGTLLAELGRLDEAKAVRERVVATLGENDGGVAKRLAGRIEAASPKAAETDPTAEPDTARDH